MYLRIAEYFFVGIGIMLSVLLSIRTFFPNIFKNSNKFSPVMAFLGSLFVFYVLAGLILAIFMPTFVYKCILLLFAISPFIVGKLVSYKTLKLYSIIQILCVILSVAFVILI